MASFDIHTATVEDRFVALSQWWQRHCKLFSLWYLSLTEFQRQELLMKYCPDIPLISKFSRESNGEKLQATDKILPEISLEGMLASQGKIMILFFTRRLTSPNLCMQDDLVMLNHLLHTKQLPSFSNHAFDNLNTPFVDPLDPNENICTLPPVPEKKVREAVWEKLKNGELIHAEVWLALKLRRQAIVSVLEGIIMSYEEATQSNDTVQSSSATVNTANTPPVPNYQQFLQGELAQQALLKEGLEKQDAGGDENENEENMRK